MPVFHHFNQLPSFRNPVLTIGSFDGVHHGHKAILAEVVRIARAVNGESILLTFEPHPRKIIQPEQPLGLLTDPEQKIKLIEAEGIDHIVVVPFTRDFSMLSAQEYVADFLVKYFVPHTIVIGYDHHFGHSREGNITLLRQMLLPDVVIAEIPAQLIEDAAVSSTKIRNALLKGNVKEASEMLERPFCFEAMVVHGNKLGRVLGFPTANLRPVYEDILIPGVGVYVVKVLWQGILYKGMMSIGYRPTVTQESIITCEVNLLDFSEDIYGQYLTVYFIDYLRGEEKFESLDALIAQIRKDEQNTRQLLA
jgi:riboflavin kinase/FMN adenylyltransferase